MAEENYLTIPQLAKLLGLSRVTVYNRVKAGKIPAKKVGHDYIITDQIVANILGRKVSDQGKQRIDEAVHRTVDEYAEVLKRLSKE